MSADAQEYVRLLAQATETFVWLVLALVCLSRARSNPSNPWVGVGALGATLLFIPALTSTSINVQLRVFETTTMLENFATGPLPTIYPVLRVMGAVLLVVALAGRRRPQVVAAPA